jgi:hypothetical protein
MSQASLLTKGKYVDAGNALTSNMLNTLAMAVGVTTSMGGVSGTISQMLA